jgi:hypothetical protein
MRIRNPDYYGSLQNVKQVIGGTSIWFEANPDPKGHSPVFGIRITHAALLSQYPIQ